MRIDLCIKDYLIDIEIKKYAAGTIAKYKVELGVFCRWCAEQDITDMEDVTPPIVKQYTQHLLRKGLKGSTINLYLKALRVFIRYCYNEDYGGWNVDAKKISLVKQDKPVIPAFTPKEVKLMLDNCKGNNYRAVRDKAILTLFFETGVRLAELLNIGVEDVYDDYIKIIGKNNKHRLLPITPVFKKELFRFMRARESYFADRAIKEDKLFLSYRGRALTTTAVNKMLKVRGKGIDGVRVSPHTCRHFFAQQQIKMGTDIYTISRLLGHENIGITQIYLNSLKDKDIVEIAKNNSVLMNM